MDSRRSSFFFSSRRRHTRLQGNWSSDVCSSDLDWTERAAAAGKCPMPVKYPTTLAVVGAGMRDAFRTRFPDEKKHPGWTRSEERRVGKECRAWLDWHRK